MEITITIQGETYRVTRDDILRAAKSESPKRIKTYYVELNGKQYPVKQLLRVATGTTKFFDSSCARSVLTKLHFDVKAL